MKILTLSRNKLEIATTQLTKPLLIIGRSPTCDVVLRAPGIKAIHFIVEWLGSGVFDSSKGNWSIVDVSTSEENAEGVVLGKAPITIGDLSFRVIDSVLESSEMIGGQIVESLAKRSFSEPDLIEFVQVRTDSGAIEEIRHFPIEKKNQKIESLSREFKSFKIEHPKLKTEAIINILLSEMPNADLILSGRKISANDVLPLRPTDFLQVRWNGRDFYIRFVEEIIAPPIPRDFWGSKLLKRLTIAILLLVFLLLLIIRSDLIPTEVEKVPELPRVARIEVPAEPTPVPAPLPEVKKEPEIPQEPTKEVQKAVPKPPPAKKPDPIVKTQKSSAPSKAVEAKVVKAPEAQPKAGLNSEAPVKNVNQVGLLGALSKSSKKGPGIKADQLMNEAIVRETATGSDNPQIVLKTPPSGVLGSGKSGGPDSKQAPEKSLSSASTTLSGISKPNPNSTGLIARSGAQSGLKLGTETNGSGEAGGFTGSASKGASSLGSTEGGDFSVAGGGLDRETVRRIILSYRSQIRTCYERGLISNPNLEGRIVYKWQITPTGSVISAQIFKATLESSNLKTCVLDVIQGMNFPKSPNGLPTTVIYPFVFQGKRT
jgi:outer membrane biosynthesis protein TonB